MNIGQRYGLALIVIGLGWLLDGAHSYGSFIQGVAVGWLVMSGPRASRAARPQGEE